MGKKAKNNHDKQISYNNRDEMTDVARGTKI